MRYDSVSEARSLLDGTFCLYPGFVYALLSDEIQVMIQQWKEDETYELAKHGSQPDAPAPPPAPPPAPSPAPTPPAAPTPAAFNNDDDAPSVQPPSAKRAKTASASAAKKRTPDPNASTTTDDWPPSCLGRFILRDFISGKNNAKDIVFGPTNAYVLNVRGDYQIVIKRRREGRSGANGATDAYVYIGGATKRAVGVSQLRSVLEIARHFNQHPQLNHIPSD